MVERYNMISEKCIQNIKQILGDYETGSRQQLLSQDDIVTWFRQNKDKTIQISIINNSSLKLKAMLWNLDNLKAPIRSKFESRLLNLLSDSGLMTSNTDGMVSEKQCHEPVIMEKDPVPAIEDSVEIIKAESSKTPLQNTHKKEEDWFDKMLDIVAAVVRGFMFHAP